MRPDLCAACWMQISMWPGAGLHCWVLADRPGRCISLMDLRADITIANRTRERAEALVSETGIQANICSLEQGIEEAATADLVVNTLSLGHSGASLELPQAAGQFFYDISYGKAAAAIRAEALAGTGSIWMGFPCLCHRPPIVSNTGSAYCRK